VCSCSAIRQSEPSWYDDLTDHMALAPHGTSLAIGSIGFVVEWAEIQFELF